MRRIPELDSIRGFAAVLILAYHLWTESVYFGWAAVNLFFVLSGYLITAIILRENRWPNFLLRFYARRSLRIWPIYYLTLAIVVAVALVRGGQGLDGLPYYLLYLQNVPHYYSGAVPKFPLSFFHTWTLAAEEQFYMIWPLMIALLGRAAVVPACLACLAAATASRIAGFDDYLLLTNCDGFACGGLLAVLLADPGRVGVARAGLRLAAVPLVALMVLVNFNLRGISPMIRRSLGLSQVAWQSLAEAGTNLFFMVAIGLIVLGSGRAALGWLRHRSLTHLGAISYGVYLYHWPIFLAVDAAAASLALPTAWWHAPVKVGLTFAAASLSWRFIEQPTLALKSRFDYRQGPARVASAVVEAGAGPEGDVAGAVAGALCRPESA